MNRTPMPESGRKPVLLILHQEQSTPGRLGRLFQERGHPLDIRRPRFGDPLPGPELAATATVGMLLATASKDCRLLALMKKSSLPTGSRMRLFTFGPPGTMVTSRPYLA